MSLYQSESYKTYLLWVFGAPDSPRGTRSKLAKFLGVQSAYVSQVLNHTPNFSLEQGIRVAEFLKLSPAEKDYFLLLIEKERAGTQELKAYFAQKCEKIVQEQNRIKTRLDVNPDLADRNKEKYYSQWFYSALHVLSSIPEMQSASDMSRQLGLPIETTLQALDFLQEAGMVKKVDEKFFIGPSRIHLEDDSPLVLKHHMNWRLEAMKSLERQKSDHLHYSSVMTMSHKDCAMIRGILLDAISKVEVVMRPSPEETSGILCVDWFSY